MRGRVLDLCFLAAVHLLQCNAKWKEEQPGDLSKDCNDIVVRVASKVKVSHG